jgi:hypothetical protein
VQVEPLEDAQSIPTLDESQGLSGHGGQAQKNLRMRSGVPGTDDQSWMAVMVRPWRLAMQ